jgi:hypothetical protein
MDVFFLLLFAFPPINTTEIRKEIFWKAIWFDVLRGMYKPRLKSGEIIPVSIPKYTKRRMVVSHIQQDADDLWIARRVVSKLCISQSTWKGPSFCGAHEKLNFVKLCKMQVVLFILSPITVALSHSKPASARTLCDSCRAQVHDKGDSLSKQYYCRKICNCVTHAV